jgi:hypothetical protein
MLLFFGVSVPLVLSAKLPKQYAKNYYLGTQIYEEIQKDNTNIAVIFVPPTCGALTVAPPDTSSTGPLNTHPGISKYPFLGHPTPFLPHPNTPSNDARPHFQPHPNSPPRQTIGAPLSWGAVRLPEVRLPPLPPGYQPPNEPFVKKFLGHFFLSRFF